MIQFVAAVSGGGKGLRIRYTRKKGETKKGCEIQARVLNSMGKYVNDDVERGREEGRP